MIDATCLDMQWRIERETGARLGMMLMIPHSYSNRDLKIDYRVGRELCRNANSTAYRTYVRFRALQ